MTIRNDADKILREIWLRAAADPEGLRIDCKSVNTAKHYRMRLYRIAKDYRDGPNGDLELHEAVQMVSIAQPKDQWLVLVHTASAGLLGRSRSSSASNPARRTRRPSRTSRRGSRAAGGAGSADPDDTVLHAGGLTMPADSIKHPSMYPIWMRQAMERAMDHDKGGPVYAATVKDDAQERSMRRPFGLASRPIRQSPFRIGGRVSGRCSSTRPFGSGGMSIICMCRRRGEAAGARRAGRD